MKKIILIICLLLTSFMQMYAQVPGYQGKRSVVEVQAMPSLIGLAAAYYGNDLPVAFKIHGEYAIQRKRSVALEYRYMSVTKNYVNNSLVLMYSFYTKDWSLAPYGRYINIGLGYNMRKIHETDPQPSDIAPNSNFPSVHLAWGKRFIVAKRLSLNYGFEAGVPLTSDNGTGHIIDTALMLFNMNLGAGFIF